MTKTDFKKKYLNKIICGNAVDVMKELPDGSVDLIVTSPPYNLKNSTGNGMKDGRGGKWANAALQKGYSHHNDCMPHDEYVKWQRECLAEMVRLIPEHDRFALSPCAIPAASGRAAAAPASRPPRSQKPLSTTRPDLRPLAGPL